LAFDQIHHQWVVDAFDAVCAYGANTGNTTFTLPSEHSLRNKHLHSVATELEEQLAGYEAAVAEYGVSIQSDGKDSMGHRHMVNVISTNPVGSRFVLKGCGRQWTNERCQAHCGSAGGGSQAGG
jgi:hypothetical protein